MADSTAYSKIAPDPRSGNWDTTARIGWFMWFTEQLSTKNRPKNNSGINYYVLGLNLGRTHRTPCKADCRIRSFFPRAVRECNALPPEGVNSPPPPHPPWHLRCEGVSCVKSTVLPSCFCCFVLFWGFFWRACFLLLLLLFCCWSFGVAGWGGGV